MGERPQAEIRGTAENAFFVADDPAFSSRPGWRNPLLPIINQAVAERHLKITLIDAVKRPDGQSVYGIYRVAH